MSRKVLTLSERVEAIKLHDGGKSSRDVAQIMGVGINMNECLSLDILNFVPIENYSFYIEWENVGVPNLSHLIDHQRKDFDTFEQIRQKVKTKNFMQYYSLLSNIPKHIKKQIRENLTDCFNTFNPEDIIKT
jgi:hypothetical protein